MRKDTFIHVLAVVSILLTLVLVMPLLSSAQDVTPQPGIPRDSFYTRQAAGPGVSAQAASLPPASIQAALRRGGVALVFGCYNSDAPNLHEFDAELPLIAATGAGHVRLTCSMDTLEQGTSGRVRDDRYAEVLSFINLAWSYGLVTTVDVHNTGMRAPGSSNWTDNYMWGITDPAVRARHTALTTDLLRRLAADVPHDRFVFQPANEPIDQANWYDYQRALFASLRGACADCTIMIMARDWQGLEETVYNLDVGFATGPVVVDVHFYEPITLTHCSYPGTANNCPGKAYPDTHDTWRGTIYYDLAWMMNHFALLRDWRDQRGVFVNVGEFGSTDDLPDDVQTRYFADLVSVFRQYGFGFTVYEWYRNFGVKQNPAAAQVLFSGQAVPTPVATGVPTATATRAPLPTGVPTAIPTLPGNSDLDELIRLAQAVKTRQQDAQAALDLLAVARQALLDYVAGWAGG